MPEWPKSILTFGANVLTARTALRLRRHDRGEGPQRRAFRRLLGRLAQASHWRDAGVESGLSYEEFRTRIPVTDHVGLASAIERMVHGEPNVLWPGACRLFVSSTGTTVEAPRILPATREMLAHFRGGCREALLYYTARTGHAGVLRGRHLFLTGSTQLRAADGTAADGPLVGDWPAIAALTLPAWAESRLYEPGATIAGLADWDEKLQAIRARTAKRDVSLVAGVPCWAVGLAETMLAERAASGQPLESLQALWPNLECLVHGGLPIAPYEAELRSLFGAAVNFHEVYAGTEGFFAAQDSAANTGLRVMADLGIFFEFVPLAEFDPRRPEAAGSRALRLSQVSTGVDYVVLVTTPAGVARYANGDVVRFTSTEPPRLQYVGRTDRQLNAFGEQVLEKQVTDALVAVCQRHRWRIVNFHLAPLFDVSLTGQARGRHEWWIELRPGTVETPTGPQMAAELDVELQRINRDYAARRTSGRIDAPIVRLVMPGVFAHWLRFHGRFGGQNKIARCRSDRLIADELAQITKFARD